MFKIAAKIGYVLTLLAELLISLRFVLILVNANRENAFSKWVFENSEPLLQPFRGLVEETYVIWGFEIEFLSVVAIVCLMLISYILRQMIKTFSD
jgi:uncharacterized protein YggT (Ycf19 family)